MWSAQWWGWGCFSHRPLSAGTTGGSRLSTGQAKTSRAIHRWGRQATECQSLLVGLLVLVESDFEADELCVDEELEVSRDDEVLDEDEGFLRLSVA